jgi:hypothetical protein
MAIALLFQTPLQPPRLKILAPDKPFLLFYLNQVLSTLDSILTSEKKNVFAYLIYSFLLKQFTSVAVDQLERCDLPPSKLTTEFILSSVADT